MKKVINKKVKIKEETAAILCRLSRDDSLEGESYSIAKVMFFLGSHLEQTDILKMD